MSDCKFLVYLIECERGHKGYVGCTTKTPEERWKNHCRHAHSGRMMKTKFSRAIRKHGVGSFEIYVLEAIWVGRRAAKARREAEKNGDDR
jgi:predicted GIY-YIG superfamily endonuclease